MTIKLDDIIKKHPFVYMANDNYYYIGSYKFGQCNELLVQNYFKRYKDSVAKATSERLRTHKLTKEESDNIIYYFKKLSGYADGFSAGVPPTESNNKALEFITGLSDEEKSNVLEQLKDFICAFQYSNPSASYWISIE